MNRTRVGCALLGLALAAMAERPVRAEDLQAKLAAAKQAAAANQQALRSYSWLEKTELSLKGELKSTKLDACQYGPDGKVVKTAVVEPPPPEKKRGLRGKIVEKKTGEMKEEIEASAALVARYVPPSPEMMQVVANAGKVSLAQSGPDMVVLRFGDYAKAGDSLSLTFEKAVKSLRRIDVATWLDEPSSPVQLAVELQSLPDGTDYPAVVKLGIPSRSIEIRITRSNYQKLAR